MNQLLKNFLSVNYNYFRYLVLDKRALSLFRIVLGLSLLYNILVVKWSFVDALLGSNAFLPYELLDSISNGKDYSIFLWSFCRTDLFLQFYMWSFLLATIAFILGIYPRVMAFVIFFLQFNLTQGANTLATGIDFLSLHLIFWCMFLPLNEYYSILKSKKNQIPSLSICVVLLVQVGCLYLFSFLFKYGIPWKEGFAAKLMLMDSLNAWGIAPFLRSNEVVYQLITYSTLLIEAIVIILIFVKWKWRKLRLLAAVLVFGFHTLIFLSSDVLGFSFLGWSIAVLLIPFSKEKKKHNTSQEINEFNYVQGKTKLAFLVLALVCSVIIVQRNIYSIYRSYDDATTLNRLDKIMIPTPAKSFISHQYWTMFAPNPPKHIGNFGIVKLKNQVDNGVMEADFIYNSTNKKWNNWEVQLLYLLRQNIVKLNSAEKGKNIFSFWLEWKINESGEFNGNFNEFLLVEYRHLVSFENVNKSSQIDTFYYYAPEIINGNFEPISK